MPPRPATVTAFGVLNLVFAGLGCCGLAFAVPMSFGSAAAAADNPLLQLLQASHVFVLWTRVSLVVGAISLGALVAAGIGLLQLKPWGRLLSIGYAVFALVWAALGLVMNVFFVVRPALAQAAQQQGPEAMLMVGGAIGSTIGGCFSLIYPAILLIFMFRPGVVAAFAPDADPGPEAAA